MSGTEIEYTPVGKVLSSLLSRLRVKPRVERVHVFESYGRVLACDVLASMDIPPMDTSHMDGYAVSSSDLMNASGKPVRFKVVGDIKLGSITKRELKRGEAMRVPTGAFLPRGADTVLPIESVIHEGKSIVVHKASPGQFVYKRGSEIRSGERILARGDTIRAQDVGILISIGMDGVKVFKRPRVAIIATGSELVDIERRGRGKVIDSHTSVFYHMVRECGCEPLKLGIVPDDTREITAKLLEALRSSDLVLTIGGTSLGAHDLVGSAISELNPTYIVKGIKMDRGRVAGAAIIDGKAIIMMPGPIQGAMNAYILLAYPILNHLLGREGFKRRLPARLTKDWVAREKYSDFTKVLYVRLVLGGEEIQAEPIVGPTESMKLLVNSSGCVIVPQEIIKLNKGQLVNVDIIPGLSYANGMPFGWYQ